MRMKQRVIHVGGVAHKTPLIIPSFSSKGFGHSQNLNIMNSCQEHIHTAVLVSAYDIHAELVHKEGSKKFTSFNSLPFLIVDSGGYEANDIPESSEIPANSYMPRAWTPSMHKRALAKFKTDAASIYVTYDHPKKRKPFQEQLENAKAFKAEYPDNGIIFLLKPPPRGRAKDSDRYLKFEEIEPYIAEFGEFTAIGITEDEAGRSLTERMVFIAKIRDALSSANLATPIHIFGSLDTLLTPCYFAAGADIFDGLTWLRYAYIESETIYRQHFSAYHKQFSKPFDLATQYRWLHNYGELLKLQDAMTNCAIGQNFTGLVKHGDLVDMAYQKLVGELEG